MRLASIILTVFLATMIVGCGTSPVAEYPNRLYGADGQEFYLDDIEEIVDDAILTEDEKREELRALGIEDER